MLPGRGSSAVLCCCCTCLALPGMASSCREARCSCLMYLAQFLDVPFSFLSHTSSWSDFHSDSRLHFTRVIFKTCSRELCCSLPLHYAISMFWCFGTCGCGLSSSPKCMVPGAWSGWSVTGRLMAGAACFFTRRQVLMVYKCLGLKQYLLWRSVHSSGLLVQLWFVVWLCVHYSAMPGGWGWRLGRGAVMFSCRTVTSLNYLLTGWLEFVFVQIYWKYIAEQMVCLPAERTEAIFSAHYTYLFFPQTYI